MTSFALSHLLAFFWQDLNVCMYIVRVVARTNRIGDYILTSKTSAQSVHCLTW